MADANVLPDGGCITARELRQALSADVVTAGLCNAVTLQTINGTTSYGAAEGWIDHPTGGQAFVCVDGGTVTHSPPDAIDPRIDIVALCSGSMQLGDVSDDAEVRVIEGVAAPIPTDPTLPSNCIELASVTVAPGPSYTVDASAQPIAELKTSTTVECSDGTLSVDGVTVGVRMRSVNVSWPAGNWAFGGSGTSPNMVMAGSQVTVPIDVACPTQVLFSGAWGFRGKWRNGRVTYRLQRSIDGGPWVSFGSGQDETVATPNVNGQYRNHEHTFAISGALGVGAGAHNIRFRVLRVGGQPNYQADLHVSTAGAIRGSWAELECK